MKIIAKFIFQTLMGWSISGSFPDNTPKYVVIVVPHTSWMDFPIALFVRSITGIRPNFIGKASLFNGPFGWFFRSLGGIPIDRDKSKNFVEKIVDTFNASEKLILSLSPEGTRKKVKDWKTGFYYIAHLSKVPIVRVSMDYTHKEIRIAAPMETTGDYAHDLPEIRSFFDNIEGKHKHFS